MVQVEKFASGQARSSGQAEEQGATLVRSIASSVRSGQAVKMKKV